ncbi:MAG: hypothetical protein Q8O29_10945 [Polaromonas sp.]|uniref:hypothetical protein n=1 Tax=Polaromonas sp. TaxID=1869339 RepID=UPI002736DF57|nr:hypothetical protein [Polaromonas sp.]MDP2818766.1 hypothetical protein [Polaromonas sp.]
MTSIVNSSNGMSAVDMSMVNKLAMLSDRLRERAPRGAGVTGMAAALGAHNGHDKGPATASPGYPSPAPAAPPGQHPSIDVEDWDMMFDAVRSRLMRTVGQRHGELPHMPELSAELSSSLVQAVVLDCVTEMDKLHAALKRERSQRLTP